MLLGQYSAKMQNTSTQYIILQNISESLQVDQYFGRRKKDRPIYHAWADVKKIYKRDKKRSISLISLKKITRKCLLCTFSSSYSKA